VVVVVEPLLLVSVLAPSSSSSVEGSEVLMQQQASVEIVEAAALPSSVRFEASAERVVVALPSEGRNKQWPIKPTE